MVSTTSSIFGIILAAGYGRRMQGRIKALLKLNGSTTFIEKIIDDFEKAGIHNIVVVLGYKNKIVNNFLVKKGLADKITVVINRNFNAEQIISLKTAISVLPEECRAIIFTPVDHPLTKLSTYKTLIKSWQKHKNKMYVPSYRRRKGHPAIFPKEIFKKIVTEKIEGGARAFFVKYPKKVKYISVNDPSIVMDFDYPKDIREYSNSKETFYGKHLRKNS